jgi:hypothetical protein
MSREFTIYRRLLMATWLLPIAVLLIAYCAICIHTKNPWPWHEVVHEAGDRTLIGTILYFEHAARELPLDLILGVAVAGSVLFAFPARSEPTIAATRRLQRVLAAGTLITIGVILVGTLAVGGFEMLVDNLLQKHTRPGASLMWGAHWRFHLLSRAMLMLVSFGFAGLILIIEKGEHGIGDRAALLIFGAAVALFTLMTIVFVPNLDPFRDPVFIGHQVREVFTHILVTVPVAWGACLILARNRGERSRAGDPSMIWPAIAGISGVVIGVFLLVSGLTQSAVSHGQTQNVVLLVCPHFFEHTFSYLIVPLVAALIYETACASGSHRTFDPHLMGRY